VASVSWPRRRISAEWKFVPALPARGQAARRELDIGPRIAIPCRRSGAAICLEQGLEARRHGDAVPAAVVEELDDRHVAAAVAADGRPRVVQQFVSMGRHLAAELRRVEVPRPALERPQRVEGIFGDRRRLFAEAQVVPGADGHRRRLSQHERYKNE
jgi:hypothetical protein